jgi:hypothetical protein
MMRVVRATAVLVLVSGGLGSGGLGSAHRAAAQSDGAPTAALSADTVAVGEAFELRVSLTVPPRTIVYFPDTLPATESIESLARVAWTVEPTPDGGARLRLSYPLMAFRAGNVPVPGLDVVSVPAASLVGLQAIPGGSAIGAWSEAPLGRDEAAPRTRFPRRGIWVAATLTPEHLEAGVEPMPPGDVAGSSWHWPSVGLALLLSSALVGIVVSSTRARLAGKPGGNTPTEPLTLDDARRAALARLDRLLEEGLHREGRARELYARSSGIVREYVRLFDPRWGPDLTSSELMERLDARVDEGSALDLRREMLEAEVVKFGRLRPGPGAAEQHVLALRQWVDASAGVAGGSGARGKGATGRAAPRAGPLGGDT